VAAKSAAHTYQRQKLTARWAGGLPSRCFEYPARLAVALGGWSAIGAKRVYAPHVRDLEVIDSELRLLLAIRTMVREAEGRPPSTARIDQLLDERLSHRVRGSG
jgi:hypothetical protein